MSGLDDLRVPCVHGRYERHEVGLIGYGDRGFEVVQRGDWCPGGTPAELARIAREWLREQRDNLRVEFSEYLMDHGLGLYPTDVVLALADGLVAALDGPQEDTDGGSRDVPRPSGGPRVDAGRR